MNKDLLNSFFNNDCTPDQERQVLDWIDSSEENRREYLRERALFDALLLSAPLPRRKRFTARIVPLLRHSLRYAAAILVALLIGAGYLLHISEETFSTITVPAGQHANLTLPDGTRVNLNACSELRYSNSFAHHRKVSLSGEAFFDVTHNPSRPFVVETYACNIEVLGTKFDVEARREQEHFHTTLVEGSVRVTDNRQAGHTVQLQPNQRVSMHQRHFVIDDVRAEEESMWRKGILSFRNASFEEMIADFENYFDVDIEIRCERIPENLFTGKLRINEGLDHALKVLQQSASFTYRREGDKRCIIEQKRQNTI